jgi:hypothetical protein
VEVNVTVNRTKAHKMGENYLTSCPVYSKGKGFRLWKQEVQAWVICAETPENKKRLAVDLAINLPHGHALKIKERVLDPNECGVLKLNMEDGVKNLLEFMKTKVFYNDPMTDRYKLWQDMTKIMRDKHQMMTAYINEAEAGELRM